MHGSTHSRDGKWHLPVVSGKFRPLLVYAPNYVPPGVPGRALELHPMASATSENRVSLPELPSSSDASRLYAPELDALRFSAFMLAFCRHFTNASGTAKKTAELQASHLSPVASGPMAVDSNRFHACG